MQGPSPSGHAGVSQSGGGIAPIAELVVLRSLQEAVNREIADVRKHCADPSKLDGGGKAPPGRDACRATKDQGVVRRVDGPGEHSGGRTSISCAGSRRAFCHQAADGGRARPRRIGNRCPHVEAHGRFRKASRRKRRGRTDASPSRADSEGLGRAHRSSEASGAVTVQKPSSFNSWSPRAIGRGDRAICTKASVRRSGLHKAKPGRQASLGASEMREALRISASVFKQTWGHLPETLRQDIDQYSREQFMTKYSDAHQAVLRHDRRKGTSDGRSMMLSRRRFSRAHWEPALLWLRPRGPSRMTIPRNRIQSARAVKK